MDIKKKKANAEFFKQILRTIKDGGTYGYPAAGEIYTVLGGCFYGTKRGVEILKEITPKEFHSHIKEKTQE